MARRESASRAPRCGRSHPRGRTLRRGVRVLAPPAHPLLCHRVPRPVHHRPHHRPADLRPRAGTRRVCGAQGGPGALEGLDSTRSPPRPPCPRPCSKRSSACSSSSSTILWRESCSMSSPAPRRASPDDVRSDGNVGCCAPPRGFATSLPPLAFGERLRYAKSRKGEALLAQGRWPPLRFEWLRLRRDRLPLFLESPAHRGLKLRRRHRGLPHRFEREPHSLSRLLQRQRRPTLCPPRLPLPSSWERLPEAALPQSLIRTTQPEDKALQSRTAEPLRSPSSRQS